MPEKSITQEKLKNMADAFLCKARNEDDFLMYDGRPAFWPYEPEEFRQIGLDLAVAVHKWLEENAGV